MQSLLLAIGFLTTLPLPRQVAWSPALQQSAFSLYPLVGLLIGLPLALILWLLAGHVTTIAAALLLTLWVVLTGALHLDGLADSFDAWLGGHGDRERTLAIMKDPTSGPAGVTALVLLLLLKFAALSALQQTNGWLPLMLVPALARAMLPLWFVLLPYVRPGGIGEALSGYRPGVTFSLQLGALFFALGWVAGITALYAIAALLLVFFLWRHSCLKRIGGTTGDTAGALVEMGEACLLLVLALFPVQP